MTRLDAICKHCGGAYEIHRSGDKACPRRGIESIFYDEGTFFEEKRKESHIYMVYGTLKGAVKRSMAWQVHSFLDIEEFTAKFKWYAPEYDIEVLYDTLYEMQILDTYELKG